MTTYNTSVQACAGYWLVRFYAADSNDVIGKLAFSLLIVI